MKLPLHQERCPVLGMLAQSRGVKFRTGGRGAECARSEARILLLAHTRSSRGPMAPAEIVGKLLVIEAWRNDSR